MYSEIFWPSSTISSPFCSVSSFYICSIFPSVGRSRSVALRCVRNGGLETTFTPPAVLATSEIAFSSTIFDLGTLYPVGRVLLCRTSVSGPVPESSLYPTQVTLEFLLFPCLPSRAITSFLYIVLHLLRLSITPKSRPIIQSLMRALSLPLLPHLAVFHQL
ncbi:hypothetical protein JAAARDRAFT_325236 [Jaapia argillacea MUCL 33604]|uniref:Uncharacterized protein n=1 Tax=Jaapia argillacea MUCL 33604 TaxID=933084 RepID=A0A067PLH0_9AGAM|nr:hypothetical protein JAAARDRAFT_325236 [Jaapia argillacea MUCL 33604]